MRYTYLFHRPSDGLTKIGRTDFPRNRFTMLGGEKKLVVISLIEGDKEAELHHKHRAQRETGEWFKIPEETLEEYKRNHGVDELPRHQLVKKRKDANPAGQLTLKLGKANLKLIQDLALEHDTTPTRLAIVLLMHSAKKAKNGEITLQINPQVIS